MRRRFVELNVRNRPIAILLVACVMGIGAATGADQNKNHEETTVSGPGTLWRDPQDIASRDLFYGPGGEEHQPHGPFRFEKEDLGGSSPKFTGVDKDNVKWKVKMGQEARPQTAATP